MLLAIDVGNTNTVLGVFEGEKLAESWRMKTDARSTADELALQFRGLLHGQQITGIAACSTVPAVGLTTPRRCIHALYGNGGIEGILLEHRAYLALEIEADPGDDGIEKDA